MINFKRVELNDKKWMDPLIAAADMRACHQNFTNTFIWAGTYDHHVARLKDYLVVKTRNTNGKYYYLYPAGAGDIKPVIEALKKDAADCGHEFSFYAVSPENIAEINSSFPDAFEYKELRDSFDYVYFLDKLVSLSGKKLQSKRNHINRFKENNKWSFERISPKNLDECWDMNVEWCLIRKVRDNIQLLQEDCAVRRCFENYAALELEGGLLRADGKVIAYTIGEKLNSDTYVVHVEKAFSEIQGAYQMINREYAVLIKATYPYIVYVNREEDMGLDGLRKAKLSYHPDRMEEKYLAKARNR